MLADLQADLIAVQEITGDDELGNLLDQVNVESARKAQVYGTRRRAYSFRLSGSGGGGGQFVGLVLDSLAVRLTDGTDLTLLQMPSGLRPALFANVESLRGGLDFQVIANHTDSGQGLTDFEHRQEFLAALALELEQRFDDEADFVVLGDLNTMGRSQSGGEDRVRAEEEVALLDEEVREMGLRRVPSAPPCSEYFEGRGGLLDHILVTASMREVPANAVAGVHGYCALVGCRPQNENAMPFDYVHASDPCPIVLDLVDLDWD